MRLRLTVLASLLTALAFGVMTAVGNAAIDASIVGKDAYLVLGPPRSGAGRVAVELEGHPIRADRAGADVHGAAVRVDRQRL